MAKNIDVLKAFVSGDDNVKTKNLKIEGDQLINYDTVIAERKWMPSGEFYFTVNTTKYSNSTTTTQNKLLDLLSDRQDNLVKVNGLQLGVGSL